MRHSIKLTNATVVYVASVLILTVVFIADLLTPLGFVVWLGYQLSIFIAFRSLHPRQVIAFAAISTILIGIGFVYSPTNISHQLALVNRFVGIVLLWITTFLLIQRRQAEDQIHEQADLLDSAHDAIIVLDLDYKINYWNKGACSLYGFQKEAVLGKNITEFLLNEDEDSNLLIEIHNILNQKWEWTGELHQVKKDGKDIIVKSSWTLVRDNKGNPKSILIINTDITEKKKIETQFLRSQRLESIGTLAAGIAHDINNVLSPIMLSLEMLQEKTADEEGKNLINIVARSAQRGANLIRQMQSFTAGQKNERVNIHVASLIFEMVQIIKETFPKNIEIRYEVSEDLWSISGDATELNQVLMNLVLNARDAMQNGGILSISAENHLTEDLYQINVQAKPGPYIVISVSDTGAGIPVKIRDQIFDPFFTTKEPGKGTGLGLSTAYAIVKNHGGFINVYSEVGKGTTFRIYLPASHSDEKHRKQENRPEMFSGHGELILIVDDEASVREITAATLEKYGYTVITADDGRNAVELYSRYRDEVQLVIMDMMMPVIDGKQSIQKLRTIKPDVKIITVSGFTSNDLPGLAANENAQAFLLKPFTLDILLNKIHDVLSLKLQQ